MNFEDIIFIEGLGVDSNCYLLNKQILVDTGTGQNMDYLYSKLKEHGVNPDEITDIVNTHCHYDHVGGNYLFPNAQVSIHELDANALKNDEDEDKNYIRRERSYGKYERSFYLADLDEDKIDASFKDGMLKITVPKKAEQKETKKLIEIK